MNNKNKNTREEDINNLNYAFSELERVNGTLTAILRKSDSGEVNWDKTAIDAAFQEVEKVRKTFEDLRGKIDGVKFNTVTGKFIEARENGKEVFVIRVTETKQKDIRVLASNEAEAKAKVLSEYNKDNACDMMNVKIANMTVAE